MMVTVALVALEQADEYLLRGTFARAAGSQEAEDLRLLDVEAQIADSRRMAARVGEAQSPDGDHG